MYIPKHFSQDDIQTLQTLMDENSFAILVTQHDGSPFASHLPFLLDRERGTYGTLVAHMARGNPQWRDFAEQDALVIFQGPHTYVSPSWYEAVLSVPTWNYAAVHAYGKPCIIEDVAECRAILKTLIAKHETQYEQPWSMEQLTDKYAEGMMRGVVAFELEITRLEGKFKLSQNRPLADRFRVVDKLEKQGDEGSLGVVELMREHSLQRRS